ncbi:MAG: hypothetical protein FJ247_09480 [Nitrospira sp.]|nr:hypothetical protein [Nitrospira sp.]
MPVNMDPSKKRRRLNQSAEKAHMNTPPKAFGEETESDREKDLADAESKNLWDATEVIDMDKM